MDGLVSTKKSLIKLDEWTKGTALYFFLMKDIEAADYLPTILNKLFKNKDLKEFSTAEKYADFFKNLIQDKKDNETDKLIHPYVIFNLTSYKTENEINTQLNAIATWYNWSDGDKKIEAKIYVVLPDIFAKDLASFYYWTHRTGQYEQLDNEILIEKKVDLIEKRVNKLQQELLVKQESHKKSKI